MASIPGVTLIDLHAVFPANPAELLLERDHAVVPLLILDIPNQRIHMGWTDRKRAVAGLPAKSPQPRPVLLDPLRTIPLDLANQRRQVVRPRRFRICTWSATPPMTTAGL